MMMVNDIYLLFQLTKVTGKIQFHVVASFDNEGQFLYNNFSGIIGFWVKMLLL